MELLFFIFWLLLIPAIKKHFLGTYLINAICFFLSTIMRLGIFTGIAGITVTVRRFPLP